MTSRAGRTAVATALLAAMAVATLVSGPLPVDADGNEAPGAPAAFRSLTAGDYHTCAITSVDQVKCWGASNFAQLGLGDTQVHGNGPGQMGNNLPTVDLGGNRTVTAVSAGSFHTCARLDNAKVRCWGRNDQGQLGLGDTAARGDGPGEMGGDLPTVNLGTGRTALSIAAGDAHTCAILDTGKVKCWGSGANGRLGSGATANLGDGPGEMGDALPNVGLGAGYVAVAIAAGDAHTCALLLAGTVKCWGNGLFGRLGQGATATIGDGPNEMGANLPPISLGSGLTATAITVGDSYSCALFTTGQIKCWGNGIAGQLGVGNEFLIGDSPGEMGNSLAFASLGIGRTAVSVSAGGATTCAILDDETTKCWGINTNGQLGLGDTAPRGETPGQLGNALPAVDLGAGRRAVAVTVGSYAHTCAYLDDATLRCWGNGQSGQLGLGDGTNRGDGPGEMGDALPPVDLGTPGTTGVAGSVECDSSAFDQPVTNAFVVAMRTTDFAIEGGGMADAGGLFEFEVPAGDHFLYLIDPSGTCAAGFHGTPDTVAVTNGSVTQVASLMTTTKGRAIGNVTDATSGAPLPGAWALALDQTGTLEQVAVANASGFFTIERLAPGPHYLAWLDPAGGHPIRFRQNSPTLPGSLPATITAGNTYVEHAALPPVTPVGTGATLQGTLTDDVTGAPLAGASVVALDAATFAFVRATTAGAGGTYALDVAPGSYKLLFLDPTGAHLPEWHADQPSSELASATPATAPGTTNAALTPAKGSITGTITDDATGADIAGAWVFAIGPSGVAGGVVTAGDGSYEVTGLAPGTFRVVVVDPSTDHVLEYHPDSTDYAGAASINVVQAAATTVDVALAPS